MARKKKEKVEVKLPKVEAKVPTELEQQRVRQAYLLDLRAQIEAEGIQVPSKLDVILGQVNQRIVELS